MPLDASFQSASFTFAGQICWPIDLGHCRDIAKAWDFITRRNMFWEKRLVARFWKMVFWHRLFNDISFLSMFQYFLPTVSCYFFTRIYIAALNLAEDTVEVSCNTWDIITEFTQSYFAWTRHRFTLYVLPVLSIGTNSVHCAHGAIAYHSGVWPSVDVQFCWSAFTFKFWMPTSQFSFLSSIRFAVVPADSSYGYLFILPASPSICAIQGCHISNSMLMHWMMYYHVYKFWALYRLVADNCMSRHSKTCLCTSASMFVFSTDLTLGERWQDRFIKIRWLQLFRHGIPWHRCISSQEKDMRDAHDEHDANMMHLFTMCVAGWGHGKTRQSSANEDAAMSPVQTQKFIDIHGNSWWPNHIAINSSSEPRTPWGYTLDQRRMRLHFMRVVWLPLCCQKLNTMFACSAIFHNVCLVSYICLADSGIDFVIWWSFCLPQHWKFSLLRLGLATIIGWVVYRSQSPDDLSFSTSCWSLVKWHSFCLYSDGPWATTLTSEKWNLAILNRTALAVWSFRSWLEVWNDWMQWSWRSCRHFRRCNTSAGYLLLSWPQIHR